MITHQANTPCPKCGSWYRNGKSCNRCGHIDPVGACNYTPSPHESQNRTKFPTQARIWGSRRHKYIGTVYNG